MAVNWTKLKISTDVDQYFHFHLSETWKDKKSTINKTKSWKDRNTKKVKRQISIKEFNIVISGQYCALPIFVYLNPSFLKWFYKLMVVVSTRLPSFNSTWGNGNPRVKTNGSVWWQNLFCHSKWHSCILRTAPVRHMSYFDMWSTGISHDENMWNTGIPHVVTCEVLVTHMLQVSHKMRTCEVLVTHMLQVSHMLWHVRYW